MARPFFRYSGAQLEKFFNDSKSKPDDLKILLEELSHRKTPKTVKLRQKVQEHLQSGSTTDSPTGKPSTKGNVRKKQSRVYTDPFEEMNQIPEATARIRSSGNLKGVPNKFQFPLKSDIKLNLDKSASLLTQYEAGLNALIKEMRKKGAGAKQLILENGFKVKVDVHDFGYQFPYADTADLFEGAKVQAIIGSSHIDGQIVAVFGKRIIIGLQEDFGSHISYCILKVDNTAMLEALRSRLEKISKKEVTEFNERLANDTINNEGTEELSGSLPEKQVNTLNAKQREAASKIVTNKVFYLWGPPGTGKTETLSLVSLILFDDKKKVLLCSNTNQAVDQVLLKLCKKFGKSHPALEEGQIVRVGNISHSELETDWSEYVTLDGIIERKSATLKKQKTDLESKLEQLNQKSAKTLEIFKRFEHLDRLERQSTDLSKELTGVTQEIKHSEMQKENAAKKLSSLHAEREKVNNAGFFSFFQRSIEAVESDIRSWGSEIKHLEATVEKNKLLMHELAPQHKDLQDQSDQLKENLAKYNRKDIEKQVEEIDEKKQPVIQAIAKINKELDDIAKAILANSKIIGATVTKAYLSPQLFSGFDVVIVDEASMVMLPALFHAAGLAKEKVIISGDFRQLSPIVQTEQQETFNLVGKDVFQTSGLVDAFRENRPLKRTVMLDDQYRMDNSICKIISSIMYNNKLRTSLNIKLINSPPPEPFHRPLTIIDTSTIFPFSNKDPFKSRYNIMHALAIRNLCLHLQETNFLKSNSVGVCTPYVAQSRLLKKVLNNSGIEQVDAGTVHHYQGDEKSLMILDIPDSLGERYAGIFLQADNQEDDGAKLFNVAISRAKNHLVVFANLAFLDSKLPNHAILRAILAEMQNQGVVIDVRDVLSLWPIIEDLKKYGQPFDLSPDAEKTGLFNQKDFEVVCQADLSRAEKNIVFYSGFITEQRIAKHESLFRLKIAEGIKIRCVTRPPHRNGNIPVDNGKNALNGLENMGCIVDTRGDIHEKVVIVDERIVWFGSLNPLSHTAKTAEMMARIESNAVASQLATFLIRGRKQKTDQTTDLFTAKENPICPDCGSRVAYMEGRYGPYWDCENCDWRESLDKFRSSPRPEKGHKTKKDILCPNCGSEMIRRNGKFGEFFGCKSYPKCTYTTNT